MSLEIIWPKHRWHYLSVADPDVPTNPPPLPSTWANSNADRVKPAFEMKNAGQPKAARSKRRGGPRVGSRNGSHASVDPTHQQGRALAVHALLQGAHCRERRIGALLEVSARTVGRDRGRPPLTAPPILERAQACIAASAERGSSPEERAAALAFVAACSRLPVVETGGPGAGTPGPPLPDLSSVPSERATSECSGSAPPVEVPMSTHPSPPLATPDPGARPHTTLTLDQVDTVNHLHRRIRLRAVIIAQLLESDIENHDENEGVLDLAEDIQAAIKALETLFQACSPDPAATA